MPLVAAKCTNCGAVLKINSDQDACVCEFCHTPFVVEKAINNYNTYNKNIYNIQNANLNIENENSIEKRLENAEIFLNKIHDVAKAKELYRSVTEDAPGDYRGWWGLVVIETENFSNISRHIPAHIIRYYQNAIAVADENQKKYISSQWERYQNDCNKYNSDCEYQSFVGKRVQELQYQLTKTRNLRDVCVKWIIAASILLTFYFICIIDGKNESLISTVTFLALIPAVLLGVIFTLVLIPQCHKIKKVSDELEMEKKKIR